MKSGAGSPEGSIGGVHGGRVISFPVALDYLINLANDNNKTYNLKHEALKEWVCDSSNDIPTAYYYIQTVIGNCMHMRLI